MGGTFSKTDIGHGRGWLETEAAKSQARIDRVLGHPQQITEAGRSWEQQNAHWLTFLKYGKPIALHPDTPSVHQKGRAKDTDERNVALMNEHGWFQTVYRTVNGRRTLVEPWHFEYFPERDKHRNDPAPAGGKTTAAAITTLEEPAMRTIRWNGKHVFTFGEEKVSHQDIPVDAINAAIIHNPDQKYLELDDAGLTTALKTFGVPWSALDACMRGLAYDITGAVGGRYWSRAVEQKIDTSRLAQSLDDLRRTATDVPGVA